MIFDDHFQVANTLQHVSRRMINRLSKTTSNSLDQFINKKNRIPISRCWDNQIISCDYLFETTDRNDGIAWENKIDKKNECWLFSSDVARVWNEHWRCRNEYFRERKIFERKEKKDKNKSLFCSTISSRRILLRALLSWRSREREYAEFCSGLSSW